MATVQVLETLQTIQKKKHRPRPIIFITFIRHHTKLDSEVKNCYDKSDVANSSFHDGVKVPRSNTKS